MLVMQPKVLLLCSVIGALGVITYTQALPIDVIYAGDACECPKKLHYKMDIPLSPIPKPYVPDEHDYKVEYPIKAKTARVTYSFDFDVEQPMPQTPIPENKLDIYAKIDRVTALKKDCSATRELPRTCGCYRCASGSRYVLPESSAARITRNTGHPNSLVNTEPASKMPPATKIVAIFFKSPNQPIRGISKARSKRDISSIFAKPSKTQKRPDRVVKQYSKRLKDIAASKRTFFEGTETQHGSRASNALRPLEQLSSFLKLPRLRNKRDIKGEYDLIEKDREQMDLTLPEIIQYMPETLDPNFKRNQCNFGQSCHLAQLNETTTDSTPTTTTTTMKTVATETTTAITTTETEQVTTTQTVKPTEANHSKNDIKEKEQTDIDCSLTHKKRKTRNNFYRGCPVIIDAYHPNPTALCSYESRADFMAPPRPTTNYDCGQDPVPRHYAGVRCHSHVPEIAADNEPTLGTANAYPTAPQYANDQLDQIISDIVHKHSDFLELSTKRDEALVDSTEEQQLRTISFLKSLLTDWGDWNWFDENQQHFQATNILPYS